MCIPTKQLSSQEIIDAIAEGVGRAMGELVQRISNRQVLDAIARGTEAAMRQGIHRNT